MNDDELKQALKDIAKYQRRSSSMGLTFLRGILYGLGFFIGSAILAAVLIYILSKFEGLGFIGSFLDQVLEMNPQK